MVALRLDRPIVDRQSHDEAFDERRADMWFRIEHARSALTNSKAFKFVALKRRDSDRGSLLGLRVFEINPFQDRWIADIVILNDRGDPEGYPPLPDPSGHLELYQYFQEWTPRLAGYAIEVTYRRHLPKQVFETGDSLNADANAQAVAQAFSHICSRILDMVEGRRLTQDFPSEWKGRSAKDVFVEQFIEPRRAIIGAWFFAFGIVAPVALITGKFLSADLLFPVAATLMFGANLSVLWIPGFTKEPVGRWTRRGVTLMAIVLVAASWLLV